ncbi:endonuclease III domain-containing protein [Malonomonas rubra]|uniref:endonuclease III domain-containing protein n=1 Tax=Malonomonas rubra TaxID=57040 RepID=UPI0026EC7C9B|nr:endonuclease III domain-containing protein [Malonomonas rubra]
MPQLMTIYQRLFDHYGPRHWWPAETPFEVAVGAMLTQNTNWSNVEKAINNLRAANALSCQAISHLPRKELETLIRPSGFFRQKAERLQLFCNYLRVHYHSSLETLLQQPLKPLRKELLELKGIGPETADSIMLYAGEHPTFVVDAYTGRLFSRLGFLDGTEKYQQIRSFFMSQLDSHSKLYNEFHALIVIQCKEHCRKKPLCDNCPLEMICSYRQQNP